jgi:thioredoxin 1
LPVGQSQAERQSLIAAVADNVYCIVFLTIETILIMKKIILFAAILNAMLLTNVSAVDPGNTTSDSEKNTGIVYLTNESFKKLIFNFETNKEWRYEGNKPAIIDFYASWCSPCRQLAPVIEEIAKEFDGKIVVYKVDTDKEQKLSQVLGISSLPTLLFIPVKGQPQASMGALPKETLVSIINQVLLTK